MHAWRIFHKQKQAKFNPNIGKQRKLKSLLRKYGLVVYINSMFLRQEVKKSIKDNKHIPVQ